MVADKGTIFGGLLIRRTKKGCVELVLDCNNENAAEVVFTKREIPMLVAILNRFADTAGAAEPEEDWKTLI